MTNIDHDPAQCPDPACRPCLEHDRRESVVRLEAALLDLETSAEGTEGMWVELPVIVDALDVRNVLDLARSI